MKQSLVSICALSMFSMLVGCARYEYSIIEPAQFATNVAKRGEAFIEREPLGYTFVDLNQNLGVRIANQTDDPIIIRSEGSYVVDPQGETHTVRGGAIAPQSYVAFALPPLTRVYRSGPRFGVGVGVGGGSHGGFFGSRFGTAWDDYPGGYYDSAYTVRAWRWQTGDVRMRIVADRAGEPIDHEFIFRREKVK